MDDGTVFIGQKGLMNYVLAVVTQLGNGSDSVVIKARGRTISKAVDVAEVSRTKFLNNIQVKDIKIGTEELPGRDDKPVNVSSIEITLGK